MPKPPSARPAHALATALASNDRAAVASLLAIPDSLADKSPAERDQLLSDLLTSELSTDGLAALETSADFGPLPKIFPEDADAWAKFFSVNPDECVAFRMEREGIRAELVLRKSSDKYRILRCNNVRRMSGEISQP